VAAENLGAVGAAGSGGAVGVQGNFPAPLVDRDMVVEETVKCTAVYAGLPAVGQVGDVVDLTGRGGLVAAAGVLPLSTQEAEQASWMTC